MTTDQFIKKQNDRLKEIVEKNIPLMVAVRSVMAFQTKRIFQDGLNSANSKIGTYDTKRALYVSDDRLAKNGSHKGKPKTIRGKTGKKSSKISFRQKKDNKTTYFANYKTLRSQQGRESGFVNLRLTNELQSDFANAIVAKATNSVAKNAKATKINQHHYVVELKKTINQNKRDGLEDKYGKVFSLTVNEKKMFFNTLRTELKIALTA